MIRVAAAQPLEQAPDNTLAKGLAASGVALGAWLGGYKYLRRFRGSADPALRGLQEKLKDTGVEFVTTRPEGRAETFARRLFTGMRDRSPDVASAAATGHTIQSPRGVLHHTAGAPLPINGSVNINAPNSPVHMFDDKAGFAKLHQHGVPENTIAKTRRFDDLAHTSWDDSRSRLDEEFGPGGWLLKPRAGSLSSVEDFPTAQWDAAHPTVQDALKSPHNYIAQQKLDIADEFRVHTVNGVPLTAASRRAPEGRLRDLWNKLTTEPGQKPGNLSGGRISDDEKQRVYDFVYASQAKFRNDPDFFNKTPMHIGFDVAKLRDGTYRLIEANPTPGTLGDPRVSRAVTQGMTGRKHQDIAAAQALGGGLAAGGLTYGGLSALDTKK